MRARTMTRWSIARATGTFRRCNGSLWLFCSEKLAREKLAQLKSIHVAQDSDRVCCVEIREVTK